MENEQLLATKIELLNEEIKGIIIEQENIKKEINQKNKLIMKKIQKLQEFCEIQEMQNKVFSRDLNKYVKNRNKNM